LIIETGWGEVRRFNQRLDLFRVNWFSGESTLGAPRVDERIDLLVNCKPPFYGDGWKQAVLEVFVSVSVVTVNYGIIVKYEISLERDNKYPSSTTNSR
jgi:hypothetical protein